jgi:hypothetical protein
MVCPVVGLISLRNLNLMELNIISKGRKPDRFQAAGLALPNPPIGGEGDARQPIRFNR